MVRFRRRMPGRVLIFLVGAGVALGSIAAFKAQATSLPTLPPVTPERLVASVLRAMAARPPISGRVTAFVDLGIPPLPDSGPGSELGSAAGLLVQVSGTHHLRVWRSTDGFRLAELLPRSERGLFVSRAGSWAWNFQTFTAYRLPTPAAHRPDQNPAEKLTDPTALARQALSAIGPTTAVSVGQTARVAGRAAYVLDLDPRSPATLVRRVEVDIDAERHLPLGVAVYARGRTAPSLRAEFDSVSFAPIDPSVYRFTPPPGARVIDVRRRLHAGRYAGGSTRRERRAELLQQDLRVFGTGWSSVVAVRIPGDVRMLDRAAGLNLGTFLPLSGPLLSIRLVDRGDHAWLVYGLVPQSALAVLEPRLP
ncbi:MAG: hypothetical protein E6G44_04065 [Actinobacteria bacterium]|nr:MAG: hypothetical protein E6G44_04065 [Actinomycetota bacterium]